MDPNEANPELESFRERWRAEVRARHPAQSSNRQQTADAASSGSSALPSVHSSGPARARDPPQALSKKPVPHHDHDDGYLEAAPFDQDAPVGSSGKGKESADPKAEEEPTTALEHYEMAVEREAIGRLGESLGLYRKAFRMDDEVDQKYKVKHFPKTWAPKTAQETPLSSAPASSSSAMQPQHARVTEPVPAPTAEAAPAPAPTTAPAEPLSIKELIASCAGFRIEPAEPEIEGTPPPPCPIAELPEELLVHILRDVAVTDVGDFVRLARVCRRFAFLVTTENRIWRRVCLGSEFGFGGMHYHWQRQITWGPLNSEDLLAEIPDEDGGEPIPWSLDERAEKHAEESRVETLAFLTSLYGNSWQRMFRLRPRIRFNGCYISTVNYIRAGQASMQLRWDNPVHIVTYYRYLRFFRDGTVISLLTTADPNDVVHYMTREMLEQHRHNTTTHLPGAILQAGLKGRWRLSSARDHPEATVSEVEGDLTIETEGVGKYNYRLDLALRNAGKGARNNKLAWKGFYSYDRLTDDWAEFTMKNNKPFYFSRVKSYGTGE